MASRVVFLALLTLGLASQPAHAQAGTGSAPSKAGATLSAPVAIAIPGPLECVIPSGTATQTVSDPYALSTTEIHFTDSHTGAGQSHWNPLTVKAPYVHSVSCYKGVFVNMKDLPRGLTCTMSTMNPAAPPNTGNAVKVLNCK